MTRTHGRLTAMLAAFIAAVLLLAGCSGGADDSGTDPAVGLPGAQTAPEAERLEGDVAAEAEGGDASVGSTDTVVLEDRSVIYMVDLVVRVDDVAAAGDEAEAVATRFGGYVQSESTYGDGDPMPVEPEPYIEGYGLDVAPYPYSDEQAFLVLRVPADRYEQAVDELEAIGETVSRNRNAQDVTDQVVDVETRIETQEASIDRLQTLLADATEISDILAIETELTRRIAELESLKARQQQLSSQTQLATITVTFVPPETVVEEGTGFVAGLRAGWDAFLRAIEVGLTALGAALPFVAAIALVTLPLVGWLVWRHRRRASTRSAPAAAESTPGEPEPARSESAPPSDG